MASGLTDEQLPSLFRAADEASLLAQRDASRWTGGRLVLLLAAAVAGVFAWRPAGDVDLLAVAAAVGFFVALLLEVRLAVENPERRWYQGRAAAESVKTLAWRYAVGGAPLETGRQDAEDVYLARLAAIVRRLQDLDLAPTGTPNQITPEMRALRGQSLEVRREAYARDRVEDQFQWYSQKSRRNRHVAGRWSLVVSVATALGFAGALCKAIGLVDVDLLGIASALVASVTAWTQLRQHRALAAAYAVTAAEVGLVRTQIGAAADDETAWAEAVSAAEEAFSREHTLWLARRAATP